MQPSGPSYQVAFDMGSGHRCISHDRTNPFDLNTQAEAHLAWEKGWEKTDAEANACADVQPQARTNPFNPITHPDSHLDWSRYWEGPIKRKNATSEGHGG